MRLFITLVAAVLCILCINVFADLVFPSHIGFCASGEIKQASSLFDCDVKHEDYLLKNYYKTASLIAASTKGAAIFSGADRSVAEQMYEYGKNLGLSFQVVDDILDFTQSAEVEACTNIEQLS
ncbi:hypothetical protein PVK06_019162 [Gossypium arboreum]|uniref:Uncharacterized protein n=1 Tax=Gossypium arboreum TaxID=29729 RepID=A0ABR0PIZ3_GOSAR|nr:hypothetical protein PVK06_019162 [Gossypium arboreum]